MQKFKKADREKIMHDWLSCVPAMRKERSMSLMKTNGPLLVGLYLRENRANTSYIVIPHVHNLTRPFGAVSLTLAYPLRNKRNTYQDDFTLKSHYREFPDACERLHKQTLFPLTHDLALDQILGAYDRAIEDKLTLDSPETLYEDILSLLSWCWKTDEAKKRFDYYTKEIMCWDEDAFRGEGGRDSFINRLAEIVDNPARLRDVREEQISLLKLDRLPDYGLRYD